MKKFLTVISILSLVFCSISGLSEGIDLKSMSDEELIELRELIDSELDLRGVSQQAPFSAGTYVVGKDIAAGEYDLFFKDISAGVIICTYRNEDDYSNKKSMSHNTLYSGDNSYHVSLTDGMVLMIELYGKGSITIAKVDAFWKP